MTQGAWIHSFVGLVLTLFLVHLTGTSPYCPRARPAGVFGAAGSTSKSCKTFEFSKLVPFFAPRGAQHTRILFSRACKMTSKSACWSTPGGFWSCHWIQCHFFHFISNFSTTLNGFEHLGAPMVTGKGFGLWFHAKKQSISSISSRCWSSTCAFKFYFHFFHTKLKDLKQFRSPLVALLGFQISFRFFHWKTKDLDQFRSPLVDLLGFHFYFDAF